MSNKCLQCSSVFIASKETSNINFCPDGFDAEFLKFPNPKYCSKCRRQQRMAFYNERQLYKRQSDLSGKDIISVYSPNKPFKVYAPEEWWGDSWDPIANGIEYDPNRSFFAQLGALMRLVPKQSLIISNCENSDYNNKIANSKNCYLVFDSIYCEDSFYTTASYNVKDSLDIWWSKDIELSAYIFSSTNLYNCLHCMNSTNSSDLIFCRHMANSKNCFGCVNLSDAEFRIFNVQYTEEEYN
ncbi:MAG: hypothetical protein KDD56_09025, partial [Bdellovibrionales bacterium]|nr:hypothetical protein [Bdellovibrionales bacterium]